MEISVLKIINDEMKNLGLNYEYGEFTGTLAYPYGVGEYSENNFIYEDCSSGGEIILTFFNRGNEANLIKIKELIKNKFRDYKIKANGGTVYISYKSKLFLRSGEADLKKMEIYLDVKYWEGS